MRKGNWENEFKRTIGGKNVTVYFNPPDSEQGLPLMYKFEVDGVPYRGEHRLDGTWNQKVIMDCIERMLDL
ncbi:MAG: hypothetical protein JW754_03575 [Candidatus Aenigmarchaeota archaeon]|nr:hypothetical protein [Candidatus Aenigmarchaeota archaeon]